MRVPVVISGWVELPDGPHQRAEVYGLTDPEACIRIDLDNDAGFFFGDLFQFEDSDIVIGQPQ